jgi:hypothetical protein
MRRHVARRACVEVRTVTCISPFDDSCILTTTLLSVLGMRTSMCFKGAAAFVAIGSLVST